VTATNTYSQRKYRHVREMFMSSQSYTDGFPPGTSVFSSPTQRSHDLKNINEQDLYKLYNLFGNRCETNKVYSS